MKKMVKLKESEQVPIYAVGKKEFRGRRYESGDPLLVFPVDAREICMGGGWSMVPVATTDTPSVSTTSPVTVGAAFDLEDLASRVPKKVLDEMRLNGITTRDQVLGAGVEGLTSLKGLGSRLAEQIVSAAQESAS